MTEVTPVRWVKGEKWWLLDEPQTSLAWHLYRQGRATGSVIGYCANHGKKEFGTPDTEALYLSGQKKKTFTVQQMENMANGVKREPLARDRYSQNNHKLVVEVGLVIPTWETRIGCSVDGIVIDPNLIKGPIENYSKLELINLAEGILEIKSPVKMYYPLENKFRLIQSLKQKGIPIIKPTGLEISQEPEAWKKHFDHIWQTHFDQMQLGMAVLNKPWSDYMVYAPNGIYQERIPYCHRYFIDKLLTPVRQFFQDKLDPILSPGWRKPIPRDN